MSDGTAATSPVIRINHDDEALCERLRALLEEYREHREPYRAPEAQPFNTTAIELLTKLLEHGEVSTHDLDRELRERLGWLNGEEFAKACGVIDSIVSSLQRSSGASAPVASE